MTVFVPGILRSGSMWTYNVTRALLTCANKIVLPQDIPSTEKSEISLINEALSSPFQERVIYCIKTHMPIEPNLPNVKIIFNYRDVREAMLSYMRFLHCDFELGLKVAKGMMLQADFYFEQHTNNIIRLRYDRIIHEPLKIIEEIKQFLELQVSREDIIRIFEKISKKILKN